MWETKPLGDICTIIGGGTPSKKNRAFYDGHIPWATVRDMNVELLEATDCSITEEAVRHSSTNIVPAHNVVIATRVGLGKVCILKNDTAINQDLRGVLPIKRDTVDTRYLFRWFQSIANVIEAEGTGLTVKGVKLPFVKSLSIPLPPFPEQQRIVAILDEAFEGIDAAIANTQQNLTNARELFESYLNNVFTQKGDGWVETTLGELASFRNGLNFTKSSNGERIKIVGVKDFQSNFYIPIDDLDSVTIDGELQETDVLQNGDILAVRSNGNKELIGRSLLARGITERTSHSGFTIRVRLNTDEVSPIFLVHFMKSSVCRRILVASGGGANISSLNQQALSTLPIHFPLPDEQDRCVSDIEKISAETQRLQAIYQQKLDALAELKQSILEKAFSGELTREKAAA